MPRSASITPPARNPFHTASARSGRHMPECHCAVAPLFSTQSSPNSGKRKQGSMVMEDSSLTRLRAIYRTTHG